jgi:hypothetical protein
MPRRTAISSIFLLGAGPWLTREAVAQDIRIPAPTQEQTLEAIAACRVPSANVRITYEDELQSDVVRIGDLGGSDEARFRCLRKAVHPAYILDLSGAPQRDLFHAFENREHRRAARAQSVAWLKARGKLASVPRYVPGKPLEEFAHALETACSIRPGSVLEAGPHGVAFRRSFIERLVLDTSDRFDCLIHMSAASDADDHGVGLAILGNEAYQTESPK